MHIASSGRKYNSIPVGIDVETWDAMSFIERLKARNLFMKRTKAEIKVFITKNRKFRARIREEKGSPYYEVTVGGKNWNKGLANEHHDRIMFLCQLLMTAINKEFDKIKNNEKNC